MPLLSAEWHRLVQRGLWVLWLVVGLVLRKFWLAYTWRLRLPGSNKAGFFTKLHCRVFSVGSIWWGEFSDGVGLHVHADNGQWLK